MGAARKTAKTPAAAVPTPTALVYLFEGERARLDDLPAHGTYILEKILPEAEVAPGAALRLAVARVSGVPIETLSEETVETWWLPDGSELPGGKRLEKPS